MRIMILNALQIYTTLFLVYAAIAFIYSAVKNKTSVIGYMICSLNMILALCFIWR